MNTSNPLARTVWALALAAMLPLAGCEALGDFFKTDQTRLMAPEKVIRPPEGSPINPILGTIGPTDRAQDLVPNSTFPQEGDWEYAEQDYIIGPTDILDVSILDLYADGLETVLRRQVSESGYIALPMLPERLKAEGLTAEELKDVITEAYKADILKEPTVAVTLALRRNDTFSILGAVARPGTYNLLRKDMRLLEALAMAGGITQTNIQYVYVIRPAPAKRVPPTERRGVTTRPARPPELPGLPPEVPATAPATRAGTQPTTLDTEAALRELGAVVPGAKTQPATQPAPGVVRLSETGAGGGAGPAVPAGQEADLRSAAKADRWIYSGGKWIRVETQPAATQPTATARGPNGRDLADPFGWRKLDRSDMARIIAIDRRQVEAGDPRMNVVIRENDVVHIPVLEVGEFYVMGEVLRPGVYTLTGRQITVKMAMAAAGNMTAMAWPENSILIRRIGSNQEQIIPLNLESICQGKDPDIYLKPNDVIAVGTDVRSTFLVVMRNAFRMTYGFGFIYDRNFADPLTATPDSRRFTRW